MSPSRLEQDPEQGPGREPELEVVGLMVGTSLDGIDAARVRVRGRQSCELLAFETVPFRNASPVRLREIAADTPVRASDISALADALARDHAFAVTRVDPGQRADLVAAHGVTVCHAPGASPPHGWQLLGGGALAARVDRPVACDFRSVDLGHGGQGAPLAPVVDFYLRRSAAEDRVILNLGGIANLTVLPAGIDDPAQLFAGDVGPANLPLDAWMRRTLGADFDADGAFASRGRPLPGLSAALLKSPWFSRPLPRSCGREEFGDAWLDSVLAAAPEGTSAEDLMATIVKLEAMAVGSVLDNLPGGWRRSESLRVLVTGGGRHNRAVMAALAEALPSAAVETIEAIGENGDAKEAVDFAWLGARTWLGELSGIGTVTGAGTDRVAGALYSPHPGART